MRRARVEVLLRRRGTVAAMLAARTVAMPSMMTFCTSGWPG